VAGTLSATAFLLAIALPAQAYVQPLDRGWEFRQQSAPTEAFKDLGQWRPAVVPGDIHLDLLREKLIPDPFYRTNEARLQWISNADWEYHTRIEVDRATLAQDHVELVFDGLGSYATVTLNGHTVLTANNIRAWRMEIKPLLHCGGNELRVVFPSSERTALRIAQEDPWNAHAHTQTKTYVRKAAYEFGWDLGPTFITSGIWRPARSETWSNARIVDVAIHHRYRHFLEVARDSNTNMVRLWGGGYYESGTFYDMCDELGLMIWLPELRTVDSYTNPQDRTSIFSPVMLAHQKSPAGNELINIYMLRDYTAPKGFPSLLDMSQALQAEGVKIGAEHFRRERPITMVSLYWQLNDCWPVASRSSMDSPGRGKALQFYAKRFYMPLLVSPHVENGDLAVHAISDGTAARNATMDLNVHRIDSTVVLTKTLQVSVPPLISTVIYRVPMTEVAKAGGDNLADLCVTSKLSAAQEETSTNLIYLVPTAEVGPPHATLQLQVKQAKGGADLTGRSDALARSIYLDAGINAASFSDNIFGLESKQPSRYI
jgi:beta-galactosidase/beta-glucuronidase